MSKNEGPYLDWSGIAFTEDPRMAWLGNIKGVRYAMVNFPLAFIMEKVPAVKRQVRP